MSKSLISVIVFGLLLLFLLSPFSGLSALILVLFIAATYNALINLFRAFIGKNKTDANES